MYTFALREDERRVDKARFGSRAAAAAAAAAATIVSAGGGGDVVVVVVSNDAGLDVLMLKQNTEMDGRRQRTSSSRSKNKEMIEKAILSNNEALSTATETLKNMASIVEGMRNDDDDDDDDGAVGGGGGGGGDYAHMDTGEGDGKVSSSSPAAAAAAVPAPAAPAAAPAAPGTWLREGNYGGVTNPAVSATGTAPAYAFPDYLRDSKPGGLFGFGGGGGVGGVAAAAAAPPPPPVTTVPLPPSFRPGQFRRTGGGGGDDGGNANDDLLARAKFSKDLRDIINASLLNFITTPKPSGFDENINIYVSCHDETCSRKHDIQEITTLMQLVLQNKHRNWF
uniref:Uncharacterized protein n=1 Tax=Panulirus argus virus 1 TaxID=380624 RepID=A0A6G9HDL7_9VIRU|nr:hypothetical protein [Panulirus argus virus 1]